MRCHDCGEEIEGITYDTKNTYETGEKILVCRRCMVERLRRMGYKTDRKLVEFEVRE